MNKKVSLQPSIHSDNNFHCSGCVEFKNTLLSLLGKLSENINKSIEMETNSSRLHVGCVLPKAI